MAEITGYIYDEIKRLAYDKKTAAIQRVDSKYNKELEKIKQKVIKEITPKILKAGNIKVRLISYGELKVELRMPADKKEAYENKYQIPKAEIYKKNEKEKQIIEQKYSKWLYEFAKKANEGTVIDLPKFD